MLLPCLLAALGHLGTCREPQFSHLENGVVLEHLLLWGVRSDEPSAALTSGVVGSSKVTYLEEGHQRAVAA